MATFFGEVVTGSYRYFDDEDEDAVDNAKEVITSYLKKHFGDVK